MLLQDDEVDTEETPVAFETELIPGVEAVELGRSEWMALRAVRMVGIGRRKCPGLAAIFEERLGRQGPQALSGIARITERLPLESARKLTLGWPCVRGVTWDEAAILALMEASQSSNSAGIYLWLKRLGVSAVSPELQKGLIWTSTAFVAAGKAFDPCVTGLSRAVRPASVKANASHPGTLDGPGASFRS